MLKIGYGTEFNRKGLLNKQINDRYQQEQSLVFSFLDNEGDAQQYLPLRQLLDQRSQAIAPIVKQVKLLGVEGKLPYP